MRLARIVTTSSSRRLRLFGGGGGKKDDEMGFLLSRRGVMWSAGSHGGCVTRQDRVGTVGDFSLEGKTYGFRTGNSAWFLSGW